MSRQSLKYTVLILLSFFSILSCKKPHNDLNTYPDNSRLLNVTKKTQSGNTENYRFLYDSHNRVTQIVFTTDNPLQSNTISTLFYNHDTVFDYMRHVDGTLVEKDTFVTDQRGYIITTFIQGVRTNYQYLGKLLTRIDYNNGEYDLITSYNGNFVKAVTSVAGKDRTYKFFTDQYNRVGDYFQLQSFTRYGFNLYQNSSLVTNMVVPGYAVDAQYVIEADSRITKTTATISYAPVPPSTNAVVVGESYELQYEKIN